MRPVLVSLGLLHDQEEVHLGPHPPGGKLGIHAGDDGHDVAFQIVQELL